MARAHNRERGGSRNRFSSLAFATALLLGFTALGFGSVGGTHAFLLSFTESKNFKIQAGTRGIHLNGAATMALGDMKLAPGVRQAKAFTVANIGDVNMSISYGVAVDRSKDFGKNIVLGVREVAGVQDCTVSQTAPPLSQAASVETGSVVLAKASKTFCLELGLADSTPQTVQQDTVTYPISVTIKGTQVRHP